MAPTFVFNSTSLSTLDGSKTYYLQMVTATPSPALVTIADLGSTTVSTPQILTGVSYVGGVFNFPDQIFNTRTYVSAHVGFIIAEKVNASFNASDLLVAYSPHTNSFNQEIIMPIGTYAMPLDFAASGLFGVVNAYQYSAGSYVNNGATLLNNGIIQLIGTKNNTVAYINPANGVNSNIEVLAQTGNTTGTSLFSKGTLSTYALDSAVAKNQIMFRFRSNGDIKFNSGGLLGWFGNSIGTNHSIKLWGSNLLNQGWLETAIADTTNWTELVDFGSGSGAAVQNRFSPTFSTAGYYKYLKIGWSIPTITGGNLAAIELYNCTIRTPNQNFV